MELLTLMTGKQVNDMPTRKVSISKSKHNVTRTKMQKAKKTSVLASNSKVKVPLNKMINVDKLINSMTLDELLEASKISNEYLHGEKISKTHSQKAELYCNMIVKRNDRNSINVVNERIVELNQKIYTPSQQAKESYKKFMDE